MTPLTGHLQYFRRIYAQLQKKPTPERSKTNSGQTHEKGLHAAQHRSQAFLF